MKYFWFTDIDYTRLPYNPLSCPPGCTLLQQQIHNDGSVIFKI